MSAALPDRFRTAFFESLRSGASAGELKQSALDGHLAAWTRAMTTVVVEACERMGWQASARAHKLALLPVQRSEYLALDIVAFADGEKRWRFPAGVMELENQRKEDSIAYSLWKVMSVRADLHIVICYRRNSDEVPKLLAHLREEVVDALGIGKRVSLEGETMVVVGTRNDAETFPNGFFSWWTLDTNLGRFQRM